MANYLNILYNYYYMPNLVDRYMTMMHENFELQNRMILANSSYEQHLYNMISASQQASTPQPRRRSRSLGTGLFNQLFQDVVIRPSSTQISTATRVIVYGDISNPPNTQCPITQEEFNAPDMITQILHCRHCFNSAGINRWWRSSARCPVCRYDIRDYSVPEGSASEAASPSGETIPPEPTNVYNARVYNSTNLSNNNDDIYVQLTNQLLNYAANITDISGTDISGIENVAMDTIFYAIR